MAEAEEIDSSDGKVKPKRRFDQRDFDYIAEYIDDEFDRRKRRRGDRERCWADIDRQIDMMPDNAFKYVVKNGVKTLDTGKAWMSEMELPLQAQALEVLTADARRMLFPDTGSWFRAHAEVTDEYLRKIDYQSIIKGDETDVPSRITQDNADKLVEGFLLHLFGQTDFQTRADRINAESFKYGMGIGRGRLETKSAFIHEARGVVPDKQKMPVLVPCSVKNVYLDEPGSLMHSAQVLSESPIYEDRIKLANLQIAAAKGSKDPDDPDGGWMPAGLKGIEGDDDGYVTVLEMEGDIVVPRKTMRSVVLPGCIVTMVRGSGKDGAKRAVVRFRWRKYPFSSYVLFPYHYEGANEPYPTSPLMKGRPVQMTASNALNRLLDSAMLKNMPPVSYDRADQTFGQSGGPAIFPGALWASSDPNVIKAHTEIGGDPSTLSAALTLSLNMYAELTGVLPGRLGAQTVSHTTAFSKEAELTRGAVRTVDYVRQVGQGAYTRWLDMAYRMGRDTIGREGISFFIEAYGGFVEITKEQLPENAIFEWFGSGGPAEEAQKRAQRMQSLSSAVQIDMMGAQLGKPPRVNLDNAIDQTLREGGWTDIDAIVNSTAPVEAPSPQGQLALPLPDAGAVVPQA